MGWSIPRGRLLAAVGLIAAANALAPRISWSWSKGPWISISETFGVSAIIWLAFAAVAAIILSQPNGVSNQEQTEATPAELAAAAIAVLSSILPMPLLSAALLVPLAIWMVFRCVRGDPTHRCGLILLSLTLTLFWGPFLLRVAPELLEADAMLVAWVLGGQTQGNIFSSIDGSSQFLIAPGCSSLNNISLATILAVTGSQYFGVRTGAHTLLTIFAASAATVVINMARLATIAWNPNELDYWHHGMGAALFSWIVLITIAVIVGASLDRAMANARS